MHILYFHQHFSPEDGIGNNRSYELAEHWASEGCRVTIVCGSGNFRDKLPFYKLYKTYRKENITIERINIPYSHFHSFSIRIISFISFLIASVLLSFKWRNADIIYASSTPLTIGLLGLWYKFIYRKPYVFETVDLWPDVPVEMGIIRNRRIIKFLFLLEKHFYKQASLIVCLSEGMKGYIIAKGIREEKILVAHNGSNCSLFKPVTDKTFTKTRLRLPENSFVILYAGTVGLANDLRFLIDVAEITAERNKEIVFLIVGYGNRKTGIIEYVNRKSLKNVLFKDSVNKKDVKVFFDAADAGFVCFAPYPILETNSANKFFDYLSSGIPVLINYGGWQKDYLQRYKCGFSSSSASEISEFILKIFSNKILRIEMGKNARKLAKERFDRKKISQIILQKLNSLAPN